MEEHVAVQNMEEKNSGWSFDALLKEKEFQSEFDRRVSRALETARGKWAREMEEKIAHACAEAEERARMTGEERMAHDLAEREAQLAMREKEITGREMRAEALRILQERGLPEELAGAVNYTDAETVQASLDNVENAFRVAVQSGVEQRLRGHVPAIHHRRMEGEQSDADYYRANYAAGKRN